MGSGHALKETRRPVKNPRERKRRMKNQKAKLAELGVPESELRVMNGKELRELLVQPEKTKKAFAKSK